MVPGSVPPWRALRAESARALKAFFSVLCVSKSVLLLESKFGQISRALNLRVFWAAATFFVAAPWTFHFRQSRRRGSLSSSLRLIRFLSTFAVETLLALSGAELPSWRGVAAKRKLEIIAKPLGLLHEALLNGRNFLRTETRSYSLPLQRIACRLPICLVRRSPIFAVRHLLHRSRCARALLPLCFRCVRFVGCAGVKADPW